MVLHVSSRKSFFPNCSSNPPLGGCTPCNQSVPAWMRRQPWTKFKVPVSCSAKGDDVNLPNPSSGLLAGSVTGQILTVLRSWVWQPALNSAAGTSLAWSMFILVNSDSNSEQGETARLSVLALQAHRGHTVLTSAVSLCRNHRKCSSLLLVFQLTRWSFNKVHFPVLSSHLLVATDLPHFLIWEKSVRLNTRGHVLPASFYCGRTAMVLGRGCELFLLPDLSFTSFPWWPRITVLRGQWMNQPLFTLSMPLVIYKWAQGE